MESFVHYFLCSSTLANIIGVFLLSVLRMLFWPLVSCVVSIFGSAHADNNRRTVISLDTLRTEYKMKRSCGYGIMCLWCGAAFTSSRARRCLGQRHSAQAQAATAHPSTTSSPVTLTIASSAHEKLNQLAESSINAKT